MSSKVVKRKRTVVSFEKKLEAIKRVDRGELLRVVAADLGVSRNAVGDWVRDRKNIERNCIYFSEGSSTKKSTKTTACPNTSEALYLWFCPKRQAGVPISGPFLRARATILSKQFPDEAKNFSASEGWLSRWKSRYGIRQMKICGQQLIS